MSVTGVILGLGASVLKSAKYMSFHLVIFCCSKCILKWLLSIFKTEELIKVSNSCIIVLVEFFILLQEKGKLLYILYEHP